MQSIRSRGAGRCGALDLRRYRGIVERARARLRQQGAETPLYQEVCIGREAELQHLECWWDNPDSQLLTLTGPSGIGKTHLALAFLRRRYAQGDPCLYINLTLLRAPSQIVPTVFHALDVPFVGAEGWERVAGRIFVQPTLLVLDDFDLLLPEGATAVQALLAASPQLRIMATSQQPLRIPAEQVLELPPLVTPALDALPRSPSELAKIPSVALFLSQAGDQLHLNRSNAAEIARLCADLGGHPGRLVRAGLYARSYSWAQLWRQYRAWFGLQQGVAPTTNPEARLHHLCHTLREEEQRVLRCLLVFPDSFDGEAAAAAALKEVEAMEPFLQALLQRGYLEMVATPVRRYYRLRRVIRSVVPPLTAEQRAVVLERLVGYYRRRLQPEARARFAPQTPRLWCLTEQHNLEEILEHLARSGRPLAIAELFQRLVEVCDYRPPARLLDWGVHYVGAQGWLSDAERVAVAQALLAGLVGAGMNERANEFADLLEAAECPLMLGRYWHNRARGDRARENYLIALVRAEARGDRETAVHAATSWAESEAVIGNLRVAEQILRDIETRYALARLPHAARRYYYYVAGYLYYQRGRFLRSRELYAAALRHAPNDLDIQREQSRVELELGSYRHAYELAETALKAFEAEAEPHLPSIYALRSCCGDILAVCGDYNAALEHHQAALEFWRTLDQPRWVCWTLNRLAEIELLARDAGHSWALHRRFGVPIGSVLQEAWTVIEPTYMNLPHRSRTLHNLGWWAWHEGRFAEAEHYLAHALALRADYGNEYGVARTQELLARVRLSQGHPEEAQHLFKQASQIRARLGAKPYPQIKRCNLSLQRRRMRAATS